METYFDENEFYQNKKLNNNINPYLEALNFFTQKDEISNNFSKVYADRNKNPKFPNNFDSLKDFIIYFQKKCIKINEKDNPLEKRDKANFIKSPEKIFYSFLDELHKLFRTNIEGEEKKENNKIKAIEYDSDNAYNSFKEFCERDRSLISDLFFGIKLIKKTCKNCSMTQYKFRYIKAIPLNIQNITKNVKLELLIPSLEKCFEIEDFCQMCSNRQTLKVVVNIIKVPENLILIITNNQKKLKIKFENNLSIHKKKYSLTSVSIFSNPGILDYIFKCGKMQCKTYYKESTDTKWKTPKGIPYVLFYKKMEDDGENEKYILDNFYCNTETLIPEDNDKEINQNNNIELKDTNLNYEDFDSNEKLRGQNEICLYFTFKNNNKQIYLDTDDGLEFYKIIEKLKEKYNLDYEDINEQKVHYKGKKIDCLKCPRKLGLSDGTNIEVY